MKIIDILNKQANRELENGFEFKHNNIHYVYFKSVDDIQRLDNGTNIGWNISINRHLNDEVEVIEEIDIQKIKPFIIPRIAKSDEEDMWTDRIIINKLIKSVKKLDNKLNKERKEKLNEARQKNNTSNKL